MRPSILLPFLHNVYADRNSQAWTAAWDGLANTLAIELLGTGEDLAQEYECEVWQYMGTIRTPVGMTHTFRHRYHPVTKRREYRHVLTEPLEAEQ